MATTMHSDLFEPHRRSLFGICYRMTGDAADAEDLVQATFERALTRPPPDLEAPLGPWLRCVATRLSIDALRKRKRERYFGPWLPAPVETERLRDDVEPGPEARYGVLESASFAFLIALEALDARQRAVVLLRDVMGLTGPEVADVLEVSPGNVRVILHRARALLEAYDAERRPITNALRTRIEAQLSALLGAIAAGDVEGAVALLADDAVSVHDGAGEYIAAVRPVRGPAGIVRLYQNIASVGGAPRSMRVASFNGLPTLVFDYGDRGRYAPLGTMQIHLDGDGRVRRIHATVAPKKLVRVRAASPCL